jgi:hypothetical protein
MFISLGYGFSLNCRLATQAIVASYTFKLIQVMLSDTSIMGFNMSLGHGYGYEAWDEFTHTVGSRDTRKVAHAVWGHGSQGDRNTTSLWVNLQVSQSLIGAHNLLVREKLNGRSGNCKLYTSCGLCNPNKINPML